MIARRARKLHVIEYRPELLDDTRFIEEMRSNIRDRDFYVIKNLVDATALRRIRAYLTSIGRNSLPSWSPLEEGCPDFHRAQQMNPNSPVQGILHQFMFHPWNQNVFDFFDLFALTYRYRNLISGLESDNFLKYTSSDSYCARLAFQFYPRGGGMMNQHSDPVGEHQLTVPTVQMSKKGGGLRGRRALLDLRGRRADPGRRLPRRRRRRLLQRRGGPRRRADRSRHDPGLARLRGPLDVSRRRRSRCRQPNCARCSPGWRLGSTDATSFRKQRSRSITPTTIRGETMRATHRPFPDRRPEGDQPGLISFAWGAFGIVPKPSLEPSPNQGQASVQTGKNNVCDTSI